MRPFLAVSVLLAVAGCRAAPQATAPGTSAQPLAVAEASPLMARVVAVGVPDAGAISPVGTFHAGGPIHDKPEFAAFTQPGEVLAPERLLVASGSNFGAPLSLPERPAGAILSIDPAGADPLVIPADFARAGNQASAVEGRVRLFAAQSPGYANRLTKPSAVTADLTAASNPSGISINNGFGRPWVANAPDGPSGPGTETVLDPDGRPLANPPSEIAGGVFAGKQTNRPEQRSPGALVGTVGNALLGKSPDGGGKAVFAVVNADGSLAQVHVKEGVDGLAPAGTIHALPRVDAAGATQTGPMRAGMLFNWTPDRILYVADPVGNAIAAVTLADDGTVFRLDSVRRIEAPELAMPVDIAAVVPEVANPDFSSNTTLAGGSDLYVANRANGTIVRLRQDGKVVGVRQVQVPGSGPLGPGQLNGIAISPDARRIWVTVSGALPAYPDAPGAILEVPAFGSTSE
jgi:hypothetical protein